MYVHDLDFPLLRERERERERERAATLVHALCFDASVDVFVNEESLGTIMTIRSTIKAAYEN